MEELESPEVHLQTRWLRGLWRRVGNECASNALGRRVAELEASHRQLARRASTWPRTATAARHERRCLEALQSARQELESRVAQLTAARSEVEALIQRNLGMVDHMLREPPSVAKLECRAPAHPLFMAVLLAEAAVTWLGLGLGLVACCIVVIAALTRVSRQLEFDGRLLRISPRLFGLRCWAPAVMDLAEFKQVVLTNYEVTDSAGNRYACTRVVVRSPDAAREICTRLAGTEVQWLGCQLRDWCATAARQAGRPV